MTPSFHPFLVNGRTGDPALYVDTRFAKRAILFDLGDLHALEPRKILRLTDIFVSHTHIDHFIGFDRLLRILLGRDARIRLYGPVGFVGRIAAKLDSYSWNLVERFASDLVFDVVEVTSEERGQTARFRLKNRFGREDNGSCRFTDNVLLSDDQLTVEVAIIDHGLPCLAFALREPVHVNIWPNRLDELGLTTGPWLRNLKRAIVEGRPDDMMIMFNQPIAGEPSKMRMPLGTLKRSVTTVEPGQKIAYATDIAPTSNNFDKIEKLAALADCLFIEATFASTDEARALDRDHLTTDMAGRLAAAAGVRQVEPFHFSSRYSHQNAESELLEEVESAFRSARSGAHGS